MYNTLFNNVGMKSENSKNDRRHKQPQQLVSS